MAHVAHMSNKKGTWIRIGPKRVTCDQQQLIASSVNPISNRGELLDQHLDKVKTDQV